MKTLTANALTEIAKQYGTEPITIVEIVWSDGSVSQFADKDITDIDGKILALGAYDLALTSKNVQSRSVSLTLDDTDGLLKGQLDSVNVHKQKVRIYQHFGALATTDKFTVFVGQISSPIEWGESNRQVSFDVLSEIESFQVGFSPEEGQLSFVSDDLAGKPWPLAFGDVVHAPATKVKQVVRATLIDQLCLVDPMLAWKKVQIIAAYQQQVFWYNFWQLAMNGADGIARPVEDILRDFIDAIVQEDVIMAQVRILQEQIDHYTRQIQKQPQLQAAFQPLLKGAQNDLQQVAINANLIAEAKEQLKNEIELVRYEIDLKEQIARRGINAYNEMRRLAIAYNDLEQLRCQQERCERTEVKVTGSRYFEQNTDLDVIIKQVRFRGQFSEHKFTISAGPMPVYTDLNVDEWQKDDAPCTDFEGHDGIDLFWLKDEPAKNLKGMYLLLKKRGGQEGVRHIVKVRHQVGRKVYIELVPWDRGGSDLPRGVDLDGLVNRTVDDIIARGGPFGIDLNLGLFTGELDPNIYNDPRAARVLDILRNLPDGANREEIECLTLLVYLSPKDQLGNALIMQVPGPRESYTIIGEDVESVDAVCGIPLEEWLDNWEIPYEEIPDSIEFNAEPGSAIRSATDLCEIYIANVLPSTIRSVFAYRRNEDGERKLTLIPSSYYVKNESANLGSINVTSLSFPMALEDIPGEQWEDIVYVSLTSSIGPNVVDVMQHIVETYTDGSVDSTSFAAVKTAVANYPTHFALFDRPNALAILSRIAWESRIAIWEVDGVFFVKYLSVEPSSDDTITTADIVATSAEVEYSQTEELTTEIIAYYQEHYLPLEEGDRRDRLVFRHNVKRYQLHSQEENFITLNLPSLVEKSATFWLIRNSNTWKRFQFRVPMSKVRYDLLDTITLNIGTIVASSAIKSVIEQISHSSETNEITVTVNTGVRAGELTQYPFFWPAGLDAATEWPTEIEITDGFAGGYGPGSTVTGTIDDC